MRLLKRYKYDFYLAGPMSGIKDHNYPAFNIAATKLRQMGFKVFNPAEVNKWSTPNYQCMHTDIDAVLNKCEAIIFLTGWRDSEGANIEAMVAKACSKKAFEFVNDVGPVDLKLISLEYQNLPFKSS